jgi:hypothetical protein
MKVFQMPAVVQKRKIAGFMSLAVSRSISMSSRTVVHIITGLHGMAGQGEKV